MSTFIRRALALLCLAAPSVHANVITIEPDDFAPGAYISYAIPGVTLSTMSLVNYGEDENGNNLYAPTLAPVYSHAIPTNCVVGFASPCAATGDQVFGYLPGSDASFNGTRWGDMQGAPCFYGCSGAEIQLQHVLRLDFAFDASSVDVLGWFMSGDPTEVFAYDALGSLVGSCSTSSLMPPLSPCLQPYIQVNQLDGWGLITVQDSLASIRTVLIGGRLQDQPIDRIRIGVPEPETLGFLAPGILFLFARRRRKSELNSHSLPAGL